MIDRNAAPAADVRRALLQNGYSPLPCTGKAPPLKNWQQKFETNTAEIDLWSKTWPCATNTGILCRFTPCLDIDVLDAEAAGAVEDLVRERFEDAGYVLTRIGKAPKRAVPFRTQEPFAKIAVPLIAPNGDTSQSFAGQGRNVTDKPGTSYAPAQFAKQSEAEDAKITSKDFAKSMERLFEANKIKVVSEGSASRQRTRLVEVASTDPSTDLPPPSTVPCTPPPHTPRPGGSGLPGAGTPARPTGQPEKGSRAGA